MPGQERRDEDVKPRALWFRLLRWVLILSNFPVAFYLGIIGGNLVTYVGQSPAGISALLNVKDVANQVLLRFFALFGKSSCFWCIDYCADPSERACGNMGAE
ncbi:MAG TPA: hypothetical protein VMV29_06080 [Ktedonobacterales bacterium]|nr:hypothetical protein [Ktedonobacterales bacterium]